MTQEHRLLKIAASPAIAVEVAGQGQLVVFLHGIGGNRKNWLYQLDAVAAEFTAAAWDARGYGDSEDYEGGLRFGDFSNDLVRVVDHFGVQRVHLVGISMGGRIALDFYSQWPDRVASLTLADTSAGNSRTNSAEAIDAFLAIRKRPLLEGKTPRDIAPAILATLVGPGTDELAREQMRESLAQLRPGSYLKTLDTVTRYSAFPPFESIAVPTLVLVGEHDRIAPPEHARDMASRIPQSQFAVIAGASHISNMDRPGDFNRLLLEFLRANHARGVNVAEPWAKSHAGGPRK
ncbi:MAG TPA: alpha/beta fold hydrolase [Steroidobacteraceae bacterium]